MNKEKLKHIIFVSLVIVSTVIIYNAGLLNKNNSEEKSIYYETMNNWIEELRNKKILDKNNLNNGAEKLFGIFINLNDKEDAYEIGLASLIIWDYVKADDALTDALRILELKKESFLNTKLYAGLGHYYLLKNKDVKTEFFNNLLESIKNLELEFPA